MRRTPESSPSRGGFTLVELLVVITIIGILAALTTVAVIRGIGTGDELKLRNEMTQLNQAVHAFKQQYAVGYMPDRIVLPPGADPTNATQQYFKSVWPRLSPLVLQNDNTSHAYWGVPNNQTWILQGDQALLFWLGGPTDIPGSWLGNRIGWSTDGTDPMKQTGSRVSPFYSFPTARLQVFGGANRAPFPSLVDTVGAAPYIYFSTNRADNSYNTMPAPPPPSTVVTPITITLPTIPPVSFTLYPYQQSGPAPNVASAAPRMWVNPSSFQIISAGKDGSFHDPGQYAGGLFWVGGSGADQSSFDNIANFHPSKLGSPNN